MRQLFAAALFVESRISIDFGCITDATPQQRGIQVREVRERVRLNALHVEEQES
jgi:hypothetical protein